MIRFEYFTGINPCFYPPLQWVAQVVLLKIRGRNEMQLIKKLMCMAGLVISMSAAQAVPIHWTLNNVVFQNGSTATGSFNYDVSTNVYSSVLIVAAGHTLITNELSPSPFGTDSMGLELVDGYVLSNNAGKFLLNLDFVTALTNAGGTVNLLTGFPSMQGICSTSDCSSGTVTSYVSSGAVIGTSIPEPGSLALVSLALAGLALRRRK